MDNDSKTFITILRERFVQSRVLVPLLFGLLSCLAVFNATSHESPSYKGAAVHGVWLVVAISVMLLVFPVSVEGMMKWSPVAGGLALPLLYSGALAGGLFYFGQKGTVAIIPNLGVYVKPWLLLAPVYLLWLIRFSPRRSSTANEEWKAFGMFVGLAGLWWFPLILAPLPAGFLTYFLMFVTVYWLDGGDWKKIVAVAGGMIIAGVVVVLVPSLKEPVLASFESVEHDLIEASFGNGGLLGGAADTVFQAKLFLSPTSSYTVFLGVIETTGLLGGLFLLACFAGMIVWGRLPQQKSIDPTNLLVGRAISAYFCIRFLLFLAAICGGLPKLEFSAPLLNAGGGDLVAVMLLLMLQIPGER